MLGAIAGDIIGSIYEHRRIKTKVFPLFSPGCTFTDDSVLTIALAQTILDNDDYAKVMKEYFRRYPDRGYGASFYTWAGNRESKPYNSWGNGAAMRISPVGFAFDSLGEVLEKARIYTEITHNHPEGIKGAQAAASAVFLATTGKSKKEIREYVEKSFGYDLSRSLDEIRPGYRFDVSCQGTVPQAITAFLESTDYVDAVRNAISLGGDSDTLACITGGIAHAFYGELPVDVSAKVYDILDDDLDAVTRRFMDKFVN